MNLGDVFCQDGAIEGLCRAFESGRMAHAYLFVGEDGVGRETTARAWAKMLLCGNRKKITKDGWTFYDSCGVCTSCGMFESGGHPDYRPVYKEMVQFTRKGKDRKTPVKMPIDVIREFLIEKVAQRPQMSEYAVYVVSEAEKVNDESQNALLKVLEEPPPFCVILLICSRLDEMLPTTQSRCRVVRFGPVDEDFICEKLLRQGAGKLAADYWSRFCQGSAGTALDWGLLQSEKADGYKIKKEIVKRLAGLELADVVEFAGWLGSSADAIGSAWAQVRSEVSTTDLNRRAQKGLIQMIIFALTDAMKLNIGRDGGLINADQPDEIKQIADRYDADESAELTEKAYEKIQWVEASVNGKLIFEGLLCNLAGSDILESMS